MQNVAFHVLYLLAFDLAVWALLVLGAAADIQWCRSSFRGWDFFHAALLGGDGKHSISAYCGAYRTPPHLLGRWAIDLLFGRGHCHEAAVKEGLLAA